MTRRACLDGKYLITPQPTAQMKQAQTLEIRKKSDRIFKTKRKQINSFLDNLRKKTITFPLLIFYNQKELYYIRSNSGRVVEATPKIEKLFKTRKLATTPKNRTKILLKIMKKCSQDKNLTL